MTQELSTQTKTPSLSDYGFGERDIVIPRLLLAQNTSESVSNEQAKLGDILVSMTNERVAGFNDQIEIVPIHLFKNWRIYNMSEEFKIRGGKLLRIDPFTHENAKQEWEGRDHDAEGRSIPVKRQICTNAYVLLKRDLEAGNPFPLSVVFKSASFNAGKQIVSLVYREEMMGRQMFTRSVLLGSSKQKKETNTYAIFEVRPGSPIDPKYLDQAAKWQMIVRNSSVKEDESENERAEQSGTRTVVVDSSIDETPF